MIEKFLNNLEVEKNYSTHTVKAYRTDLNQFSSIVEKDLKEITRQDIINFLKSLKLQGYSFTSTNRKLASIKSFFKFLMIEEVVNVNPAELVESAKVEKTIPDIISTCEYNQIMDIVDNLEDRSLIEILFVTGLRREEVVKLKRNNFNFNTKILKVNGKGKKERIIPLINEILPNTILWLKQHNKEWIFPSKIRKGKHNTTRWVNRIIRKWADKAGYPHITPHSFRHSFGTHLYENGADIKAIQEMMGHESTDTTNIYAKSSIKRNRQEFLKAHPLIKRP